MLRIKSLIVLSLWTLCVTAQQSSASWPRPNNPAFLQNIAQMEPLAQTTTPEPDQEAQAAFDVLMAAIEANNFAAFASGGDAAFKAALTRQMFGQIVAQMASRMKQGYNTIFFGELKQHGYQVYVWKVAFQDEGDDLLIKLAMKDGKVSGFFFL